MGADYKNGEKAQGGANRGNCHYCYGNQLARIVGSSNVADHSILKPKRCDCCEQTSASSHA